MIPARNSYEYTSYLFEAERDFSPVATVEWVKQNWWQCIILSAIYVAGVFGGKWAMKDRTPYGLKAPLVTWNLLLAAFSFLGMARSAPSFVHSVTEGGVLHSICRNDYAWGVSGFWAAAFTFSKPFELVDTAFLVLRKRPIVFLHWYHHITAMLCAFLSFKDVLSVGRWYLMMNYSVHTFMYGYYGLRAMGVWFPKWIPMTITIMQITQMVVGCAVASFAFGFKLLGGSCDITYSTVLYILGLYATYFYLFATLFHKAYFVTKKYDKKETKVESQVSNVGVHIEATDGYKPNGHPGIVEEANEIESAYDKQASSGSVYAHPPRLRRKEA